MWANLKNYLDAALLVVRVIVGALVIRLVGWPTLAGGLAAWRKFALGEMHLTLWPSVWGFLAAMVTTVGCTLLILGFFTRPVCLLLVVVFGLLAFGDFRGGGVARAAHTLELTLIFFTLLFAGAGKYSLDKG